MLILYLEQRQIRGATQNNPYGFKFSQFKTVTSSSSREKEHMDVLALELQCRCDS